MLNDNMQSLAFSPIPEQNPIEAYGNMLHSDGFISVSGINRRKICRSRMVRRFSYSDANGVASSRSPQKTISGPGRRTVPDARRLSIAP